MLKTTKRLVLLFIILSLVLGAVPQSIPYPKFKAFDTSGLPLSGGKVYSYAPGTTTLQTTYSDRLLTPGTENANPITLDSMGEATIWTGVPVKLKWYTSAGVYVGEMDWLGYTPTNEFFASNYGVLPNGADMTAQLLAAETAVYTAGGGVLKFGPGTYRVNGQWRWRPGVSLKGAGAFVINGTTYGVTVFDCRSTTGPNIYADEKLNGERYEDFTVIHNNNTSVTKDVDMIQLKRGLSRGKIRIGLLGKAAATRNGLTINGANPATGTGNNNLYGNDIELITSTYDTEVTGGAGSPAKALQLGEITDIADARANVHTIRGKFAGWATQCFINGQSVKYLAETNPASVAGVHFYGNGCYLNRIQQPAYFDATWTGARVLLTNNDSKIDTMVIFDPVPGLISTTQFTKAATAYPGDVRNTIEQVYTAGCAAFNPADVSEYWFGAPAHLAPSTTADSRRKYIQNRGNITKVKAVFLNTTSNGTNDCVCTLKIKVNNTTEYSVFTSVIKLTDTMEVYTTTALSIPVQVGDYIEFRFITSTWATNPVGTVADVTFTVE